MIIVAKTELSADDKREEASDILDDYPQKFELNKALTRSIDKIMIANRNTKLFFILMSGPFLGGLMLFKYACKLLILYLLYK